MGETRKTLLAFVPTHAFLSNPGRFTSQVNARPVRRPVYSRANPRMGVRVVESYDGSFKLSKEVEASLGAQLLDSKLIDHVSHQANAMSAEFTGLLFQPVPYSTETPHGMPKEMEVYYNDPDYAIINVPPLVMFNAKCFKPPRLCAVFRLYGREAENEDPHVLQSSSTPEHRKGWSSFEEVFRQPPEQDEVLDDSELDKYVL